MNKKATVGRTGSLGAPRRAYHSPRVSDFGDLADLTKASSYKDGTKSDTPGNTKH